MQNYTGTTLEEALQAAAADKNVAVEELTYFVKEDRKGLMGEEENLVSIDAYCLDDVKEFLFDYLGNFFMGIDCDLEAAIEEKNGGFIVNLNAENNAVLIGRMGKTLAALNTVVRGAVNAEFKKRIDVLVDVNHYKDDRYRKIISMAKRTARQVQRSHVDAELDPMPNDERKVIHKALSEWHNIRTESYGEGLGRHVCIKYVPDEEPKEEIAEPAEQEAE